MIESVLAAQAPDEPAWQTAAGGKMAFEVASVKPDNGPFREPNVPLDLQSGNAMYKPTTRFSADFGLITYLEFAWKTRFTQQQLRSMRAQLPGWIFTGPYDDAPGRYAIEARAGTIPTKDQIRLMMQSLLADRFQLKVHFENQETEVLAITPVKPGKMGPKLRPHSEGPTCTRFYGPQTLGGKPVDASVYPPMCEITMGTERPGLFRIGARNATIAQLVEGLYGIFDRPLIDRTGITGTIDYQVEFPFPAGFRGPARRQRAATRSGNGIDGSATRAAWVEAGTGEGGTPGVGDRSRGTALGELMWSEHSEGPFRHIKAGLAQTVPRREPST